MGGGSASRGTGRLLLLVALVAASGCRGDREAEAPPSAAGRYVVLEDSSRIHVLFLRDGEAEVATFGHVLGSVTFAERDRGLMLGNGSLTVDLTEPLLPDSAAARALARDVFQIQAGRENRTATVAVREIFGRKFAASLPTGGVTPVTARAQLVLHGRALSRSFDGEITRTPSGYRLTTAVPIVLSIRQLGLEDEIGAWVAATGGRPVADAVGLTLDLRLARRTGPEQPEGTGRDGGPP